ncbi:MAG: competence/damage-inducible protein A [Sandaracinaceae bacterium]|nr:competence/damage-inducible protein A [Sandaracinaceae bacterium]
MTAAVLSIGTELTRGELVNTNAAWISDQLTALGCEVTEHVTVPDDPEAIRGALDVLSGRNAYLVSTGGLGPTSDDVTAVSVASAAGVELERHLASLEAIRERYAAAGRELTDANARQADIPRGADVLPNPVGTAPGFALDLGRCRSFFLPGVPSEMKRMFSDRVRPLVASTIERKVHQIRLRTFGLPESVVAAKLEGLEAEHPGVCLGYRATFPEIEVKVWARTDGTASAEERVAEVAREVRRRLGEIVYGEGDDTYAAYVGRELRARRMTLALAESCTGGLISSMITDVPGSSDYLLLDAVTYSNASKSKLLGVSGEVLRGYGAVSSECAGAMADGARRLVDADLAVSVTGIAGPGGGTEDKPVGTVWIALASREAPTVTEHYALFGDRHQIRTRAAYLALRTVARAASR